MNGRTKMENEIVKQAPTDLINSAIQKGADLEQIEKLLELQFKWEANEARKAYNKAMAEFKSNPPKIDKDKKVGYSTSKGKVGYSHASLYNVVDKITAELSKHGLSASWRTEQNGQIKVTCRISHSMGHYEETSLSADADTSGSKNAIQAVGSTITYLERYSLLAITGLATEDQDNDGNLPSDKIDENKVSILKKLIEDLKVDKDKFYKFMSVEKIEDIPVDKFAKAKVALEAKRRK